MAKKTEKPTSALDAIIEAEFTEVENLATTENNSSVPYFIDSGNYALNYAISKKFKGGYPGGRISSLSGLSGVGKSMLPMIAAKAKDENGEFLFDRIFVIDSEGGGSGSGLAEFVDAPTDRIRYVKINTLDSYRVSKDGGKLEAVKDSEVPDGKLETPTYTYRRGLICFLKKLIYAIQYNHTGDRVLFIIDSLSNIKSFRSVVENGEDMGKSNKLLNNFFALDTNFAEIGASVIIVNKVYTNLANQYDPWIISGGQSVIYNPSVGIMLSAMADGSDLTADQLKEEKLRRKTALGNSLKVIRARMLKSRFGTENRNVWFLLDSTYGMVRNSGLFDLLLDFGAIKKNGTRYLAPGIIVDENGQDKSFFKKEFLGIISGKEDFYLDKFQSVMDEIEKNMKESRMGLNVNDLNEAKEEEENSISDMVAEMEVEAEIDRDRELNQE